MKDTQVHMPPRPHTCTLLYTPIHTLNESAFIYYNYNIVTDLYSEVVVKCAIHLRQCRNLSAKSFSCDK